VLQQLKDQRRRDLVRRVGNADVEEGHVCLDCVALNQLELVSLAQFVDPLGHFGDHPRVDLHGNDLFAPLQQLNGEISRTRPDF